MKITSWNVNGLRAMLRKDSWDWVKSEAPDMLCLQEIKARPDQLTKAQHQVFADAGYEVVWNPAERPGYSGVATFSTQTPGGVELGMKKARFDIEGRVIQTVHDDFRLFNIYFPNGQRSQERLDYKLDFYDHLLKLCKRMHKNGEQIIICGDVNTAHAEIDLRNPKENQKTSGFLPEERAWIDKYLANGFVDVFRFLYPEKEQYTWWTYRYGARKRNIGWRIDYFLVSEALMPRVQDLIIHDDVLGSDHCPLTLVLA